MTSEPPGPLLARAPLRVTLVIALLVLAAVGLTATGLVVTTQLRGYLINQVDADLAGEIPSSLFRSGGQEGGPGRPDGAGGPGGDVDSPFGRGRPEWLRVLGPDGSPLLADRVTDSEAAPPDLGTAQVLAAAGAGPFTVPATGGEGSWRVVVQQGQIPRVGEVLAVRAISLADVAGTVRRLVLLELLVGLLVLVLLGGLAYVVVRTSLRPLEQVERTAGEIAAGDLTRRVPDGGERTEVGRLSRALNGMLGQIEVAFRAREASESAARSSEERMRRFVADASHELRTPLTSIRGYAELYRQGAVPDSAELDRVMRRVEDEAARMGLLVADMLLLARLDQQRPLEQEPVDLLAVAGDAVHDARVLAPDRDIALELHGAGAPVVLGDEARLRQVVTNLLSNAVTHTPAGTPVTVTVEVTPAPEQGPARVLLAVTDAGPGMTEADRARVFERFYRVDPSRTRSAGGSGLGLSIVSALVAAHGGRVGVVSAPGEGSRFLIELTQHDASTPDPAPGPAQDRSQDDVPAGSQPGRRIDADDLDQSEPTEGADPPDSSDQRSLR